MNPAAAPLPSIGVIEADARRAAGTRGRGPLLLDVRERDEFEDVRVPDAVLLPMSEFAERFAELPRDRPLLVMCAAVADYKPAKIEPRKMKKRKTSFALELIPTRDILASLPKANRKFLVIGFAAETHDLKMNARRKLREKNCDFIVANDVSKTDFGMESDTNAVTIFLPSGESKKISRTSKKIIARELVKIISKMSEKRLTKKA